MPTITPFLWYDDQAEPAARYYTSLFEDSRVDSVARMPDGSALVVEFTLLGQPYRAMNGGPGHPHTDAVSFQVDVDTQDELDRVWDALLADGGEPVACGWLRDRWGLSWQVTPSMMGELMTGSGDPEANARVFAAMQQMVKLDIPALRAAAAGH
ncbi:VOC family protein [Curtobacterium sp. C1]|uniref:VOC family protein n=1 Tax=Curtobacterium TaxID=2034 RepID=UPI000736132C|nr:MULTISPECIES: VOC family protein [Curtobacterium]MCS5488355.1 VOC family protein [Curtobacterium flaccumfaciens pv. basellae]KTR06256.1 3-demethylubiquinone-9 3-methyltransferase [Curtobacterium citreum]MDK8172559.1 VOC family protein [Curtobacterium citreum]UFU15317.1 VOC family protein [Curtobacterium sp. C1]WIJ46596.1 VOC family protein [Curtobacterium citreum]